ncbi:Aste57867_2064 [Aphanomyces stellatus]|uniref:Aste57867_2064 protein n=1 Tax=Aphanomyces stellatus TaxID=120398 RepID=A0A485K848_9STRA|nr:hypothetical protein As57867_002060 [Aphanomyces stellatus]VFT79268.1 Aste57867_2064 [Aphanomyces stellatus]
MNLTNTSTFQLLQSGCSNLTSLEAYWMSITADMTPFELAFQGTGNLLSAIFVVLSLACVLMDITPSLRKYKMQPSRPPTQGFYWQCLKQVLFNRMVVHVPASLVTIYMWGDRPTFSGSLPLPRPSTVAWDFIRFMLLEDFLFYWIHRFLHWKKIYKYVHKVHHEFSAPFGLASQYTHPVEDILMIMSSMTGPLLFGSHILCLWIWLVFQLCKAMEEHAGYDFPITMSMFLPFKGSPARHDYHHEKFDSNFGSTMAFWDWLCGTDAQFRALQHEKAARGQHGWFDLFDYLSYTPKVKTL